MDVAPDRIQSFQTPDRAHLELRLNTLGDLFDQESAQKVGGHLYQEIEVEHAPMMALVEEGGKTGKHGCSAQGAGQPHFPVFSVFNLGGTVEM